jgi:hypothetical protein
MLQFRYIIGARFEIELLQLDVQIGGISIFALPLAFETESDFAKGGHKL